VIHVPSFGISALIIAIILLVYLLWKKHHNEALAYLFFIAGVSIKLFLGPEVLVISMGFMSLTLGTAIVSIIYNNERTL